MTLRKYLWTLVNDKELCSSQSYGLSMVGLETARAYRTMSCKGRALGR